MLWYYGFILMPLIVVIVLVLVLEATVLETSLVTLCRCPLLLVLHGVVSSSAVIVVWRCLETDRNQFFWFRP